jgi:hypothetical protein
MVLYITDLASSEHRTLFGLPVPPDDAPAGKLLICNVATGQWHDVNVGAGLAKRFAFAERPLLTFDVGATPRNGSVDGPALR